MLTMCSKEYLINFSSYYLRKSETPFEGVASGLIALDRVGKVEEG